MRIASYNVENLFNRAKAMNLGSWSAGKPILDNYTALFKLLGEHVYAPTRKRRIAELLVALGLEKSDIGPFVMLRQNRGHLVTRRKAGLEIIANGRADWVGSLELISAPVDEEAMRNTARVMIELQADVMAVIEAENRLALAAFNADIVGSLGGTPFAHVMLIDGNDARGIDVGLMTRDGLLINRMRSHVDDRTTTNKQLIFSRDCPEFEIFLPSGERLLVLVNHLKSKGYGGKAASDAKRRLQAERIKAIYEDLTSQGEKYIAIVGDFNDTPDSHSLAPLLQHTDLRDAFTHPSFDDSGYPGTYGACNAANKIDYLLLSPALFTRMQAGGIMRKGMWPGTRPRRWDVFDELQKPEQAGSDHAAVWADIDL